MGLIIGKNPFEHSDIDCALAAIRVLGGSPNSGSLHEIRGKRISTLNFERY
jgi:hypothetical protein